MKRWRELLGNERGTALALAMIILVVITALAIGLATMGGVESQISASQSAGTRARLLAEAGIEYAFTQLAGIPFSTKLAPADAGAAGSYLVPAGTTLPGLTAASGTFVVTIRNDIVAGDTLLTGAAALDTASAPAGTATLDVNGIVILTSTGTVDGATRVILAVVQRGNLGINGALTLPGLQADTTTDSPCPVPACPPNPLRNYSIDGRDWKRTDTTGGGPTGTGGLKLGIATGAGMEGFVESAFSDSYRRDYVQGMNENSPFGLTTGLNTINQDTTLTPQIIQNFLTNLAANPGTQIIKSTQACQFAAAGGDHSKPEGLHMASTGSANTVTIKNNPSACSGSDGIDQTVNLGSATSPQMIYFKGEYDPSSNFVGVGVDGSNPIQGYGLLVVEDADLVFFQSGNFRWDGIVLVTGRNVSVAFKGNSNTEIRGALIGSETNGSEPGGYFEFFNRTTASMVVRASKENIDLALLALYNMRITGYRETCTVSPC
jgi:hypothetical protein